MSKTRNTHSYTVGVKLLSGKSFSVIVGPSDSVAALKQRIFEREGIPPQKQNLLVMGKLLQPDSRAVAEYNLKPGDMVYVTAGVRGPPPLDATGAVLASGGGPVLRRDFATVKDDAADIKSKPVDAIADKLKQMSLAENDKSKEPPPVPLGSAAAAGQPASAPSSPSGGKVPGTDVTKLRASTIQHFAKVTTVLRPHSEAVFDESNSRWPRQSQAYCVYTRKGANGEITGIITFGLSNPYQNTFYYAIGIGIEIMLEAPTTQSRLSGPDGAVTGATISESWMFAVVHEMAHQCFALGLQIRQLLEKLQVLSVEIAGINLPAEYLDPETGRCCVLLGHLGDPDIPRGFNVTVPHQHQWILQSVLFVPARVVPYAQCMAIRKDGAEARRKVAEEFLKNKSYSINDIPPALWPVTNTAKVDAPTTATPAAPAPAPATHGSSTTSSSGSSISKPP